MLHGTPKDNMKFVVELLDKVEDHRNMIVSPGCDMPMTCPWRTPLPAPRR